MANQAWREHGWINLALVFSVEILLRVGFVVVWSDLNSGLIREFLPHVGHPQNSRPHLRRGSDCSQVAALRRQAQALQGMFPGVIGLGHGAPPFGRERWHLSVVGSPKTVPVMGLSWGVARDLRGLSRGGLLRTDEKGEPKFPLRVSWFRCPVAARRGQCRG